MRICSLRERLGCGHALGEVDIWLISKVVEPDDTTGSVSLAERGSIIRMEVGGCVTSELVGTMASTHFSCHHPRSSWVLQSHLLLPLLSTRVLRMTQYSRSQICHFSSQNPQWSLILLTVKATSAPAHYFSGFIYFSSSLHSASSIFLGHVTLVICVCTCRSPGWVSSPRCHHHLSQIFVQMATFQEVLLWPVVICDTYYTF